MEALFKNNPTFLLQNPEMAMAFQEIAVYQEYDKHAILHECGKICNHFYIILSGVGRVFYHQEDKNITCYFASEQESITAIDSFLQRKKSKYSVEALEDLKVLAISHDDLENLYKSNPKFERFGRLFLQQAYVDLVERIDDIQLNTTQERYEIFLQKKPELFNRVASKHIASYLGMTPETFSRIRGK
jgi:CRP-like cAMP-binding protein